MTVLLRTLEPDEWHAYKALRLRALRDSPEAFSSTWEVTRQYPDEEWQARLSRVAADTDLPLVVEEDGVLLGLLWGRIEQDRRIAQLYQMWVAPECRGRGFGRRLMDAALAWAGGQGVQRILLGVTDGDRPARRLYESVGFVALDETEPLREDSDLLVRTMEYRGSS